MTTHSSLNLVLKNAAEIDNAINTLTVNIQDALAISDTTSLIQDNSINYITPEKRSYC